VESIAVWDQAGQGRIQKFFEWDFDFDFFWGGRENLGGGFDLFLKKP